MSRVILSSGEPGVFSGRMNENELVRKCPEEFRQDNPWSHYAMKLFRSGGTIENWKWKSGDKKERNKQFACFQEFLKTFKSYDKDRAAVAGWMLSEMLKKVPEYIARK